MGKAIWPLVLRIILGLKGTGVQTSKDPKRCQQFVLHANLRNSALGVLQINQVIFSFNCSTQVAHKKPVWDIQTHLYQAVVISIAKICFVSNVFLHICLADSSL